MSELPKLFLGETTKFVVRADCDELESPFVLIPVGSVVRTPTDIDCEAVVILTGFTNGLVLAAVFLSTTITEKMI